MKRGPTVPAAGRRGPFFPKAPSVLGSRLDFGVQGLGHDEVGWPGFRRDETLTFS